jgi:hypothetical protein
MATRYSQAAQAGDDDAAFYLGALYAAGIGVQQSDSEAFRWFKRAADQGHSHALLIVSGLYAIGRGVPKDDVKAYQYASIVGAASRIDEFRNDSRQLMGVLESRMSPAEINQARTDASRWRATGKSAQTPVAPGAPQPPQPPQPPQAASNPPPAPATTAMTPPPAAPLKPAAKSDDPPKNNDVDDLLNQVPQGLRKKFGF